ncbi:hypothetical protein ACOKFD_01540 [Flagellimonas sp. S174]|uniref:hypothetical protein n=1 Tax=Flagellimonas sp. S174 TaxID=3410790 RepID=UPI00260CC87E|nr:hypothetical protein [uncultured Allomuricauda sp.]
MTFIGLKINHKKKIKFYWLGLAVIFLFLSLDEMISIHESLIHVTRKKFDLSGLFYFSWVLPYGILLIVISFVFFRFLINLPKKTLKLFVVSAIIYVGGALGVELFEGKYFEEHGENLIFAIFYTIEESMEMLGISIFIWALLDYIAQNVGKVSIKLSR